MADAKHTLNGWRETRTQGRHANTYRVYFMDGAAVAVQAQVAGGGMSSGKPRWREVWHRKDGAPGMRVSVAIRCAAEDSTSEVCTPAEVALLQALKPFAEASKHFDRLPGGHFATDLVARVEDFTITVGMLWAAADAIAKATGSAA